MTTAGKGITIKSRNAAASQAARKGRARAKATTRTMNGVEENVVVRGAPAAPAAKTLPGEKAAKDKGTAHDALKAARVLIAAAYSVAGDQTSIKPHFAAFGKGVPVEMSVGLSIDESGRAVVKATCRVEGREFDLD